MKKCSKKSSECHGTVWKIKNPIICALCTHHRQKERFGRCEQCGG